MWHTWSVAWECVSCVIMFAVVRGIFSMFAFQTILVRIKIRTKRILTIFHYELMNHLWNRYQEPHWKKIRKMLQLFNGSVCQGQSLDTVLLSIISLAPGRYACNLKLASFKAMSRIDIWSISQEIALRCLPRDLNDDKSTLVQVMAWCRQATSHYLNQCWPSSMMLYGVTRPHSDLVLIFFNDDI